MLHEQRNVFGTLPQRRQRDTHSLDPKIQVLAKSVLFDQSAQTVIGGTDDPHIHRNRLAGTDGDDQAVFENAEQLGLHVQRHIPDLVEKQRALVRDFKESLAVGVGAGEGALDVSEQLALEQGFRQAGAVDRPERLGATQRVVVDRPGQKLLARSGGPFDQHRDVRGRDATDDLKDPLHGRAVAFDALEEEAFLVSLRRRASLVGAGGLAAGLLHQRAQLVDVERLDQIVERPLFDRLFAVFDRRIGRDQNYLGRIAVLPGLAQHVQAVGLTFQLQIRHNHVHPAATHHLDGVLTGVDRQSLDRQTLQGLDDPIGVVSLVVYDQNHGLVFRHGFTSSDARAAPASGSSMVKEVPLPTSLCTEIVPPCDSTIFLAVARPSPVPPVRNEQ